MKKLRLLSAVKNAIVPKGARPRRIALGINRGIRMNLDLAHNSQMWLGLYEREIFKFTSELAVKADAALDIGAADGFFTLNFLNRPNIRRIIAFEPDPVANERLCENLRLNGFESNGRLQVMQEYVGELGTEAVVTVDSLPLDDFSNILIKLDVDGAEMDVISGARRLIESRRAAWVIETHSLDLENQLLDVFDRAGYTTRIVDNARWRVVLPEMRTIPHNRWLIVTP